MPVIPDNPDLCVMFKNHSTSNYSVSSSVLRLVIILSTIFVAFRKEFLEVTYTGKNNTLPLNNGHILHILIGPCLLNWPRINSI